MNSKILSSGDATAIDNESGIELAAEKPCQVMVLDSNSKTNRPKQKKKYEHSHQTGNTDQSTELALRDQTV
jgi:hypothetical protein